MPAMRYRVLGPVHLSPRTPSAAKPRAVLATLLARGNTVVSTHTLIDELWGAAPPRTATTTLQVYVSQLRKALLPPAGGAPAGQDAAQPLLTRPPGYLMRVAPDELDLCAFESLRAEGRAAYAEGRYEDASRALREALGLWTGPALSGVPHGASLEAAAIRLNELRVEVLEQRISADLRSGLHRELTGELMALAHEHPLREALHGHLMVALYRSGRQSDALRAYQRARRSLVDELGVEPGPTLSGLHRRILASDPALAQYGPQDGRPPTVRGPVPRPAEPDPEEAGPIVWLPPDAGDLTGRGEELALCHRLTGGGAHGRRALLVVSGPAGAGKTALAVRLAHDAADRFPDGRVLVALRDADGAGRRTRHRPGDAAPPSRGPRAAERGEGPGAGPPPSSAAELAELLHRRTAGRRMLVVLDDAVSETQVRPVLSALPDTTVVVTSRQVLGALEGAGRLALDVLAPQAAAALLTACGGPRMGDDPDAVAEIARLCGRLPLALRVAAAGLAARPHWTAAGLAGRLRDERTRLGALALGDLDVRSSLLAAYHDVAPEARRAFRILGAAPSADIPLWGAAALLGTDPAEAERLTEELVQAHLLEARGQQGRLAPVRYGGPVLLRPLARELADREGPREGTAAVERLGRAFLAAARYADARLTPGRDRLAHRAEPPSGVRPEEVVGGAPLRWFQEESAGLAEAVRGAHAAGLPGLCCALASAAAGYYETAAEWGVWEETHVLALDAALGARDGLAEAAVLRSLGDLAWQRHQTPAALDRYRRAGELFARHGDLAAAGRCRSAEADALLGTGRVAEAGRGYARALAVGRRAATRAARRSRCAGWPWWRCVRDVPRRRWPAWPRGRPRHAGRTTTGGSSTPAARPACSAPPWWPAGRTRLPPCRWRSGRACGSSVRRIRAGGRPEPLARPPRAPSPAAGGLRRPAVACGPERHGRLRAFRTVVRPCGGRRSRTGRGVRGGPGRVRRPPAGRRARPPRAPAGCARGGPGGRPSGASVPGGTAGRGPRRCAAPAAPPGRGTGRLDGRPAPRPVPLLVHCGPAAGPPTGRERRSAARAPVSGTGLRAPVESVVLVVLVVLSSNASIVSWRSDSTSAAAAPSSTRWSKVRLSRITGATVTVPSRTTGRSATRPAHRVTAVPPAEWKPSTARWPSELTETVPSTPARRRGSRSAAANAARPSGTGSLPSSRTPANSGSVAACSPR